MLILCSMMQIIMIQNVSFYLRIKWKYLNPEREENEMYCRECGNTVPDTALKCLECGTRRDEGTKFCQNCGFYTTIKTEFCLKCGAKQRTIVSQKMKNDRIAELQKQVKMNKKVQKILKLVVAGSAIAAVLLILILVLRPQPDNIPAPFYTYTLEFGADNISQPSDYLRYADSNVQEYWLQSRNIIGYIAISLIVFIGTFIDLLVQKSKYKKILKALKETK